jgi:CDP-paratose 2-epimerase
MNENILIFGGAGFVGSSLAIFIKENYPSCNIICFDNLRRRGSELNLPRLKNLNINFIHGDIRFYSDLEPSAFNKIDLIIDCSAEPSVLMGYSSPQYVLQTNLCGTMNILELCRQTQAKLIFLSTSRVYPIEALKAIDIEEDITRFRIKSIQSITGVSALGISEKFPLDGYRSLYGTTKLASEMLIQEYHYAYDLPTIINRCGVITGPWQMGKVDQGVFALWIIAHYFRKNLSYIGYGGTGKQVRDLLHIQDLVDLIIYQMTNFTKINGDTFNIGGGIFSSLSLLETTKLCQEITGNFVPISSILEERKGDVPIFITDITKVQEKCGWTPKKKPQQILVDIYEWLIQNHEILTSVL